MQPLSVIYRFANSLRVKQVRAITACIAIHLAVSVTIFWSSLAYSQTRPSTALRFTADGHDLVAPVFHIAPLYVRTTLSRISWQALQKVASGKQSNRSGSTGLWQAKHRPYESLLIRSRALSIA